MTFSLWSVQVRGATFAWDGGNGNWDDGTTATWNTGGFWTNSFDNIATFGGAAGTVTLTEGINAGGLIFNTTGYTLTGNTLTLGAGTGPQSPHIAVNGIGSRATVSSQLAGASGFTKTGAGSLLLTNNSNNFGGDIAIKDGVLIITDAGQLGTGTTAISVTGIAQSGNPGFSGGSLLLDGSVTASGLGLTLNREVSVSGRGPNAVNNTGALVSVGYNTLAGGLTFGSTAGENRIWATHGSTFITGGIDIGTTAQSQIFQGNGNWIISGVMTGSEVANDKIIKTGQLIGTTLWLQNAGNNFTQSIRVDSGTLRVQTNSALGRNTGTGQVDLNNGTFEVRTDAASGFAGRTMRVRNNTTGTVFVDHDITGPLSLGASLQNQTVTMGALIRDAGANVANFTFNGRNGYNISFTTAPAAGDYRGITVTNNSSGMVTFFGDVWNANNATASTYTVTGNGDTMITGNVVTSAVANVLTKAGTGTFFYGGTAGTYQGATNINAGTLAFSNGGGFAQSSQINLASAALGGALNYIGVGETLTKTINLNSTTGPAFIYANQVGATGPLVISSNLTAAGAGAKTLVLGGSNSLTNVISGIIPENSGTNTTSVTKTGSGTWMLSGANTNTGALTVNGGTLILGATASGAVDIYKATGAVIFNADATTALSGHLGTQSAGGILQFNGFTGGSQEALGALTATAGHGKVVIGGTTTGSTLTFASLGTRTAGATLDLAPGGTSSIGFTATVAGTGGIFNGATTYNGVDWVTSGTGPFTATAYTAYTPLDSAAVVGTNYNLTTGTVSLNSGVSMNSLKLVGSAGTTTVNLNGINSIATGGILFDNTGGTLVTPFNALIQGGTQIGAAATEVIVTTNGTGVGALTIDSPISSTTGSLTKAGVGTLVLGGASAFTGNVNINEGTVQLSGATARIGAAQAAATVFNLRQGATFDLNGAGASSTIVIGALNGAGTITNSGGGANTTSTLVIGNGATTTVANAAFTGTLQDGAGPSLLNLTKDGTGVQYLTGANSYTGVTTINRGTLAVTILANGGLNSGIGASTSAASNLVFNNGGILRYTGSDLIVALPTQSPSLSTDRQFTLAGNGTIQSSGTFGNSFLVAGAANSASIIFSSTADISFSGATGGRLLTLGGTSIGDNEMRIRLVNNDTPSVGFNVLSLTKADAGLWILNPLSSNTYTGETIVSGGALRVAAEGWAVQGLSATSLLSLTGGVLETSGNFTRTLGATQGTNQIRITGGASGFAAATTDRLVVSIDNGGSALVWGSTNFNPSSLVLGSSTALGETEITNDINLGTAARTVTVNNNGNTGTMITAGILSGIISGGAGGTLSKGGGGVLMLGDANTYVANTILTNGNIIVTSIGNATGTTASSLGASGGTFVFNSGTTTVSLHYVGAGETATRPWSITSGASTQRIDSSGSGALNLTGGFTNTSTGAITLELRGSNTDLNTISSNLANNAGNTFALRVVKNDGGVWALTGNNTYAGGTRIDGGLLGFGSAAALGTATPSVLGGNNATSSTTVTLASTAGLVAGMYISGNGIAFGDTISSITNGTQIVISTARTIPNNSALYFGGLLSSNGGFFATDPGGLNISQQLTMNTNTSTTFTGSNPITLSGQILGTSGNPWTISNNLENNAVLTISGTFSSLDSAAVRSLQIRGFGNTILSGNITDSTAAAFATGLDIRIADTASVTLSGNATTYTGTTLLGQGTLILNRTSGQAQFGASSQFIFNGGSLQAGLALTGANKITTQVALAGDQATVIGTNSIEFGASGVALVNSGGNRFLRNELTGGATLTISGGVSLSNDNTARTLTIRGSSAVTISGVVGNGGTGAGVLAYSGLDTLTLTAANTATGALVVNRNNIVLSGAGAWAGSLTLNPIGTITLDNSAGNVNRLADTGAVTAQGGTLALISNGTGTTEVTGALTLNSVQSYITISGGGSNTISFASTNFANSGSSLNLAGVSGLGTTNKVLLGTLTGSANPALLNGNIMSRVFIGGTDFATYDIVNGVKAFNGYDTSNSLAPVAPVLMTVTGTRTNASPVVTVVSTAGITPFMSVTGGGIPAGTYVVSVDSGTQLTLSQNATSSAAGTADFIVNEIHVMDLTASVNLSGNATRDAIKFSGGVTIGGAALNRLTLTAGTILNAAGTNTLSVPQVNLGSTVAYIQVAPGSTLIVDSALYGTGSWAKSLSGMLVLNTPTYLSGTTNLLNGITRLNGGLNTMFPNQLLNINNGATLDLNGNVQLVGQFSDPGILPEAGGIITSNSGAGLLVSNSGTSSTVATNINDGTSGTVTFAKAGSSTITLESVNTYSGTTTLLGGGLTLQDDATILNSLTININAATLLLNNNASLQRAVYDRVGDTAAIFLRDGTLSFTGKVSDPSYEVFGALTSAQGANTITATAGGTGTAGALNSVDLTFASLTRNAGTTINFTGTNLGQQGNNARINFTAPLATTANGALGAWAIANSTDYAAYNAGQGIGIVGQGGFAGYDGTFASGNITEIGAVANMTTTLASGTTTTGMLRIAGGFTNDLAFTNSGDILNLELGGLLRSNNNNASAIGTTSVRGVLTAGGTETSGPVEAGGERELVVYNNQNTITINSVIADNGFGNSVNFIKSGAGTVTLTANNTYTGGTTVVQGTVSLNGNGIVVPAGGVILGGAAMTMLTTSGQIDASNSITLRRGSTLTLVGNNTLDSLIFENNGGTTNPTVTIPTGGILTLTNSTPITASSSNAATTATISGGTLALVAGANTFDIDGIKLDGTLYTKIQPTLNISSVITGAGSSIIKSGDGVLQLSGQSFFNGLSVTGGGILISGNSTGTVGGAGLISGPLGIGAVAMAAGTTMLVDGSRTVGNNVSFAGTPTFDSTANTAWNLTLNGAVSGTGWSAAPTVQINNPYLTVSLLGDLGSLTNITKSGLGTLIFNSTNYTGDFNASALGNPNAVSLLNDGDGTGSVQTLNTGNVIFDTGIVGTITVGRAGGTAPFAAAVNKIIAPASVSNVGLGLTVTNNNGYGLLVSDAAVLTSTTTFSVSTASASNVTQGLYLTGDLSGSGFYKTGAGTLVINNATPANNTFTGNININQGVVSVNSDAQLGNAANVVQLNPTTGTSTFRATGTFATSRTIQLTTASNTRAIEVTEGNTLTLNSGFGLTAAAAALLKADLGTLELAASNSGWSGNLTINAGAVSTSLASSLGTGTIIVNETSAALQLSGGITVTNAITIDVLANGRVLTGFNTGGAIQSVSGSNTVGAITVNATHATDSQTRSYGFGASSGASLTLGNITYNHPSTGTSRNIIGYFGGAGDLIVNGVIDNANASPGGNTFLFKHGNGTMTLTAANAIPDTEVRVYRGGLTLNGAATFGTGATQVQVWQNGTLTIDNATTNTANRFSTNRQLRVGGGTVNFIPNAAGSSHAGTGVLTISQGMSTINLAAGGNQTVQFSSLTQEAGATLNLTGTFGTTTNKLIFTTAPTLVPTGTGLLARILTNGNEFATYAASTGIGTFTGYAAVTNILSAGATQTFNATDTTANSLTGNQTLNALKLTSGGGSTNVGGLSGLNPTTLTLTSGGILVNGTGSGSTLAVPVVAFGAVESIVHVLSGQTLDVTSGFSGTAGMTQSSNGTMNLNAQQFISGNTIVNAGTLNLQAGATNTLLFNNGLGINGSATVDLKNGVQFIGSLFSANGGGNTDLGGGTLTNSGAQATLVTNSNSNFNGQINGTIYLNKTGTNSLNLQGVNGYSGATLVTGGTLLVQDDGTILNTSAIGLNFGTLTIRNTALRDNADRISNTAPITMRGGVISFEGRAQTNSSETIGAVTLVEGNNSIFSNDADIGIGSGVLTIDSLTRTGSTATLRFNNAGDFGLIGTRGRILITTAPTLTNNIIGPWAVIDRELASYDATFGVGTLLQTGFAGYAGSGVNSNPLATDNVRFTATGTTTLLANTTLGTLTFGQQASATTLNLGTNTLTIQGGALVFGQVTDNVNFAITNGNLTGPSGGGDLFIHHLNYSGTNRTVSIDAAIIDNGGAVRVIKNSGDTGASVMTWNGTNTYTGGTVLNMGTLVLGATSTLGSGGITVYQATLTQTAGAIIPTQMLTMNGPGTVTLAGNNTLTGITINNQGGGTPTITPTGTLTLTGGIMVTTMNAGAIATIGTGTLDLNAAGSYAINVGATLVNGQDVAPWQAGLIINSVVQNGGIVKSGAGLLQLGGQSTFSGGVNVTAGGLILAASSTPAGIGETVFTGPVGTGTLTMANGTSMVATTAAIISNNVVFGDDGFGTGTHVFNGVNNITLNGLTALPAIWNAVVTAPQTTVTIADASLSLTSDVINKSGLGLLVVGSYNGTIQATGGLVFTDDGNTLGTPELLSLGGNLTITGDTAITVNRSGAAPNARNKALQKVNLIVPGNIMSVSNQSGYGLEFTGTTTMTGPSHFAVSVATASNVVQGLILSGVVDDGMSDFGIIKSGPGTLVLNGANTFGGAGQTVDILNGVVSVNADAGLGNAANSVTLNVDASTGVGLRATETFGTARLIILNQANNAIEVVQGKTLTVTSPFSVTTATNTLFKNDSGVLLINADNSGWTGGITINGGAVRLTDANAAGSGTITISPLVAASGAALQLSGGISISNAINLQGTNNVAIGGLNFGGQLESFSGANIVTGQLRMDFDAAIGARTGATLDINGGIHNPTTTGRALIFNAEGTGVINLNSNLTSATTTANQYFAMRKYGAGTLNITTALSIIPTDAGTGLQIFGGTLALNGSGTLTGGSSIVMNVLPGATLFLDNSTTNVSNRLGGRPVTLNGGTFSYLSNSGTSTETLGVLTTSRPGNTITVNNNGGSSTLTFSSLASNIVTLDGALNFVSAGAAFGTTGANSNRIIFTTAPTLTNSIIQRATVNGADFATHGANGIAAFTAYNAGSTTDINSVTATTGTVDANAAMTTKNITASRTFNALRLNGATNQVVSGNALTTLTLGAGAVLATGGGNHQITTPVLAMGATQGFISVDTGTSLEITGVFTGTAGWVKAGAGTLILSPPSSPIMNRTANTITGNATITGGTVILNGGNNTLVANQNLLVGPGATLDLNGNSQFVQILFTDTGAVEGAGGTITSTGANAANGTLVINQDNNARNWAGVLTGAMSFARGGQNTLTMYSNNDYTGHTLISGGTTLLRDGGRLSGTSDIEIVYATLTIDNTGVKDLTDRVNDAASITLRGGTLSFLGRAQTASTETVGDVYLLKSNSFINSTVGGTGVNSADLTLTSLNRAVGGGTVNFTAATGGQIGSSARILIPTINGVSTATVGGGLTNGIIGGWAIIGTSDFATYIPGLGVVAMGANGALPYTNATSTVNTLNVAGANDNISINSAVTGAITVTNDTTINSLRMGNVASNTVSIAAGKTLTLSSGGLLFFSTTTQTIGSVVNQGSLTTSGPELFIYAQGTGPQIINSVITGSGVTLVKSGAGAVILNGTNTYDGGTTINQGTLTLGLTGNIPLAANPANGLVLNGTNFALSAAGQIAFGNIVTINGPSTLTLVGNNTLAGLVFRDDGGGTTASAVTSNSGILTLNGNIVSTTANPSSTSIINGRVDFGVIQRTLDISATRFNGQELAALLSDFNLQGVVGSSGGIVKTGDGVLQFNGVAVYTGTTTVNNGRVQVGATNGGSRFSTLTLAAGTGLNLNALSTIWGGLSGSGYVTNSGAAGTLTVGFNGASTTFSGNFLRFNDAVLNAVSLAKIGTGTLTFDSSGSASTTTGSLTINRGAVTFKDNGTSSFKSTAVIVNEGGTLNLDNGTANSSANVSNRLAGGALTLNGGTFNVLGVDAAATTELAGVLTLGPSASSINLIAGTSGGMVTVTFASLTQSAGSTAIVNGTNLGADTKLLFTTAPTEVPATTGILARIAVGSDFATYDTTQGVIAFSGYTTPADINSAAATATIKVDSTTTVRNLNTARTINAVNIIDNNVTIGSNGGLLPTQGWTLTSGGVLVNGNNAAFAMPVLAFGGTEGIFRINGSSLNVASSITGTAGITKTGAGTMTLSSLQSYTGQTALNLGNLTLAGGDNTLLVTPTGTIAGVADLQINGGVLDLNGNNQAVRTLLNSNTLSFVAGEITNSSATAVTLITAMNASSTFSAKLTGNLSLDRSGNNTLTLPDAHTYTGATIIRGGGLTLQDTAALATSSITLNFGTLTLNNANLNPLAGLNPVRFAATTPLTMRGGTWAITPGGSVDNTTTINSVTILAGGANTITAGGVAGGTNTVTIGNLILPAFTGTTLNFASGLGQPTTSGAQVFLNQLNGVTPTNNAFLGANVIHNSTDYAVYNTVQGVINFGGSAVAGNTVAAYAAALASGNNLPTNISNTGADVAIAANTTIGALRMTGGATRALTFTNGTAVGGTDVLNLALGGLLRSNEAFALNVGTTTARGILTSGGTATTGTTDLVVYHNQNTVTIHSVIANNGLGNLTRLVKSGAGGLTLTAANTYTGGTIVDQGTLTINATAGAGTIVIPGDLILNNANLTMSTNGGQIAAASNITINGSGVLTLTGANTLNSIVFNNTGGNATPTVTIGTTSLTLSSLTPITVTNDSYAFTPTIAGTLLTLQDGATISTSGLSPDSLIISAPISTTGSTMAITKTGAGSLVLSSTTSAFANGFNLNQGSLIFAASSTPTSGTVTSGPIGTGTLSLADGVAILSDGTARTIANAVSVAANFTFGTWDTDSARANAGNSLTLSGTVTLASGAHTINVGGLLMVGTISGKLTGGTNLIKTGLGTLVLSSTANDFGGTTTINGGTLQLGAAGVLPDGSALTIASGAALNINGLAETIGSLAGAGLVTNSGAAATLTTGFDDTDTTFSGMIANGTNALNLTKIGTGTQTLSGTNIYTGATTVVSGSLLGGATNTFSPNSIVTVGNTATSTGAFTATFDTGAFDQTIAGLAASPNTAAGTSVINIGSGNTLTVTGSVTLGSNTSATDVSTINFTGGGSLVVGNGTNSTFQVGGATGTTNANSATVVMSSLASLTANLGAAGTFRVGDNNGNGGAGSGASSLTLATDNTINANILGVGDTETVTNAQNTLRLGSGANLLNVNTINVSSANAGRSNGTINFATGAGTVKVRAFDGTSRAAMNMINSNAGTGTHFVAIADFTGHSADLLLSTLTMSARSAMNGTGSSTATFAFDAGTLDVTTLTMSNRSGTNTAGTLTSTVNIGGGAATIGSVSMAIISNTGNTAGGSVATLNVSGGTVGLGPISMANTTGAAGTFSTTSTLNFTGGVITLGGGITRTGSGTQNTTLTLNGGTLDMAGFNIGSGAAVIGSGSGSANFQSGTLQNLGEFNGGAVLTKTMAGLLIMQGTNTYTGGTAINAGILRVNSLLALHTAGMISFGGGWLQYSANNQVDYSNRFNSAAGQAVKIDTNGQNVTFDTGLTSVGGTLDKAGAGTLVLAGDSTYDGTTAVTEGTLQVGNGTTGQLSGTGQVSVSGSGTTLAGTGSIAGSTIIGGGSVLAPGVGDTATSNATLTFTSVSSTLTIDDGGKIELSITAPTTQAIGVFLDGVYNADGGATYANALLYLQGDGAGDLTAWNSATPGGHDFINLGSGSLSLGKGLGTITVLQNGYANPNYGDVFNLMDWSSFSGTFDAGSGFTGGGTFADFVLPDLNSFGLAWDTSAFTTYGILVVVPEPSRATFLLLGILGLMLSRRRRSSVC